MHELNRQFLESALILDAATSPLLVAYYQKGELLRECIKADLQSAQVMIEFLREFDVSRPLQGVIAGAGPGSYTGLRLALASATGVAFSWRSPLYLVSSLAGYVHSNETCLACLDARSGGIYVQLFVNGLVAGPSQRILDVEFVETKMLGELCSTQRAGLYEKLSWSDIPWVSPHATALNERLRPRQPILPRSVSSRGFYDHVGAGLCRVYSSPFQGIKLDYLKEDNCVASIPKNISTSPHTI